MTAIKTKDLGIGCKAYSPTTMREESEATRLMIECPNMALNVCRCCITPYVEEGQYPGLPKEPIVQWAFARKLSWFERWIFKRTLRQLFPDA